MNSITRIRFFRIVSNTCLAFALGLGVLSANAGECEKERCHCGSTICLPASDIRCQGCCPDDYCPKPLPCVPCLSCCRTCDDYCRKPMPCVPCLPCCRTCDDYCRKPLPCLCWPCNPGYKCVTSCCRPSPGRCAEVAESLGGSKPK
jgi:hypothetical protein